LVEVIFGAGAIMLMRMADVTIGTFRTILIVQARKYYAAFAGFFEVLIWINVMRYVVNNMDSNINLVMYALGFSLGNLLGITLEEKIALGYVQLNVISKKSAELIASKLRRSKYGVTLLPGEGSNGVVKVIVLIIKRRDQKNVIKLIEKIDPDSFITVQHSRPYRGFIHGSRK
jgi:uncharacterized protein YebE (UPF0316 family)